MKNLFPVLCFALAGLFYVGCSEDYITESSGDMEHAVVDDSHGEGLVASKGKPGGGGGGGGATYTVDIVIDGIGSGQATGTPGNNGSKGPSVGEGAMTFNHTGQQFGCLAIDNVEEALSGLFSLVLVQNKHPEDELVFTYASIDFYFIAGADGKQYSMAFNVDPSDFLVADWLPLPSGKDVDGKFNKVTHTSIDGFFLEGPRKSPCNGHPLVNTWTVTVTAEQ